MKKDDLKIKIRNVANSDSNSSTDILYLARALSYGFNVKNSSFNSQSRGNKNFRDIEAVTLCINTFIKLVERTALRHSLRIYSRVPTAPGSKLCVVFFMFTMRPSNGTFLPQWLKFIVCFPQTVILKSCHLIIITRKTQWNNLYDGLRFNDSWFAKNDVQQFPLQDKLIKIYISKAHLPWVFCGLVLSLLFFHEFTY